MNHLPITIVTQVVLTITKVTYLPNTIVTQVVLPITVKPRK